jgi:hypothetical protein
MVSPFTNRLLVFGLRTDLFNNVFCLMICWSQPTQIDQSKLHVTHKLVFLFSSRLIVARLSFALSIRHPCQLTVWLSLYIYVYIYICPSAVLIKISCHFIECFRQPSGSLRHQCYCWWSVYHPSISRLSRACVSLLLFSNLSVNAMLSVSRRLRKLSSAKIHSSVFEVDEWCRYPTLNIQTRQLTDRL